MSKKSVLLVDDEQGLLEVYQGIFEGLPGYTYQSCLDGLDAYRLARNQRYDLIITDYMMPRLNGVQLIKALRENYINGKTPIIVISAYPDKVLTELKTEGLEKQVNILSKPFEVSAVEKLANTLTNIEKSESVTKMDVSFVQPFLKATINVLQQMAHLEKVEIGKIIQVDSGHTFKTEITSILSIVSDSFCGSLILSCTQVTFLNIVNSILGSNPTEITPQIKELASELTNIIFGKSKAHWEEKGFKVQKALPYVFTGKDYSLPAGKNIQNYIIDIQTEFGIVYASVSVLPI